MSNKIEIVEVGPRDGFQAIGPFIETGEKVRIAQGLLGAGIKRLETGSFVSPKAVPQLSDTGEVLQAVQYGRDDVRFSVLIATASGGLRALQHGAKELVFVISVSESHNQSNVKRSVEESFAQLQLLVDQADQDFELRLNLATSFDCPFDGRVSSDVVTRAIATGLGIKEKTEIGLCDTTGRAIPSHVGSLCQEVDKMLDGTEATLAFHGHDTYGFGVANVLSAVDNGVTVLDSAIAGLGGCPFAPGASGNTATEDVVFTLHSSGYQTGVDLDLLLAVADEAALLDGAATGGHMRSLPRERLLQDHQQAIAAAS